jgi:hypothetical protein
MRISSFNEFLGEPILKEKENMKIFVSLRFPVEHPDLIFIGKSRIDGNPIYEYIGKGPFPSGLEYTEIIGDVKDYFSQDMITNTEFFVRNEPALVPDKSVVNEEVLETNEVSGKKEPLGFESDTSYMNYLWGN